MVPNPDPIHPTGDKLQPEHIRNATHLLCHNRRRSQVVKLAKHVYDADGVLDVPARRGHAQQR